MNMTAGAFIVVITLLVVVNVSVVVADRPPSYIPTFAANLSATELPRFSGHAGFALCTENSVLSLNSEHAKQVYMRVPATSGWKTSGSTYSYTVDAWIQSFGNVGALFSTDTLNVDVDGSTNIFINHEVLEFEINNMRTLRTGNVIQHGKWHHVAVSRGRNVNNATDNTIGSTLSLYVDGLRMAHEDVFPDAAPSTVDNDLLFMRRGLTSKSFEGCIDSVRLWSYALSDNEIMESMNTNYESGKSGLVALWNFNEVNINVNVSTDHSGHGNHGLFHDSTGGAYAWSGALLDMSTVEEDNSVVLSFAELRSADLEDRLVITSLPHKGFLFKVINESTLGDRISTVPTTILSKQGNVIYMPSSNGFGRYYDSFNFSTTETVKVQSVVAFTFIIHVLSVNDAPEPQNGRVNAPENQWTPIELAVIDNDIGDVVHAVINSIPARGILAYSGFTRASHSSIVIGDELPLKSLDNGNYHSTLLYFLPEPGDFGTSYGEIRFSAFNELRGDRVVSSQNSEKKFVRGLHSLMDAVITIDVVHLNRPPRATNDKVVGSGIVSFPVDDDEDARLKVIIETKPSFGTIYTLKEHTFKDKEILNFPAYLDKSYNGKIFYEPNDCIFPVGDSLKFRAVDSGDLESNTSSITVRSTCVIHSGSPVGIGIIVCSAICASLSVAYAIIIFIYRNDAALRASNSVMHLAAILGITMVFLSVPAYLGQPSRSLCVLRIWIPSLGIAIIHGAHSVKLFVLWRIFENPRLVAHAPHTKLYFVGALCILLAVFFICVGSWASVRLLQESPFSFSSCQFHQGSTVESVLFSIVIVYVFLLLFISIVLSLLCKNVPSRFSENKRILLSIIFTCVFGGIGFICIVFVADIYPYAGEMTGSVSVLVGFFVALNIVYLPVILGLWRARHSSNFLDQQDGLSQHSAPCFATESPFHCIEHITAEDYYGQVLVSIGRFGRVRRYYCHLSLNFGFMTITLPAHVFGLCIYFTSVTSTSINDARDKLTVNLSDNSIIVVQSFSGLVSISRLASFFNDGIRNKCTLGTSTSAFSVDDSVGLLSKKRNHNHISRSPEQENHTQLKSVESNIIQEKND